MDSRSAWYVVQAEARREERVYVGLIERNIDAFVPRIEREIAHRKSKYFVSYKVVQLPLFSGYLFAFFDFKHPNARWPAPDEIPGMLGIIVDPLGFPLAVPNRDKAFQELLKAREKNGCVLKAPRPADRKRFDRDAHVRIVDGPFASFDGTCILDTGREVLLRLDKLFGGVKTSVAAEFCVAA